MSLMRLTLCAFLQLPDNVIDVILDKFLTKRDQAHFCLACKDFYKFLPAHALMHRVTVYHKPGWEQKATQVRQRLPNATVTVVV